MENTQQERENEVKRIFTNTAKSYEFIVKVTTLGMDGMWKKRMIEICKDNLFYPPKTILDLACGTGILTFELAKLYPEANIVGMDIMSEYLYIAQSKLNPGDRIVFIKGNADEDKSFNKIGMYDLIISSYIPKYVDFPKMLLNCYDILAPGGMILFHDFTRPRRWIYRAFYNAYWLGLSSMLHFSPVWREMGKDLKNIIWRSKWVEEFKDFYVTTAYLKETDVKWQPFDIACIVYATKRRCHQGALKE